WNLCVSANFANKLALNNCDITNDATIAQRHVHDLVNHGGLGLFQENLAPMFWQTQTHHLTRIRRQLAAYFQTQLERKARATHRGLRDRARDGWESSSFDWR